MTWNYQDIALNFMKNLPCDTLHKQVHDGMPPICPGHDQINVVLIDIYGQLPRRIALERDDLNVTNSTSLGKLVG